MVYNEQTYSLYPSAHVKYKIENTKLPSSNDLYFRSKQNELARQYDAARLFMGQTETPKWDYWFAVDNKENDEPFEWIFKSYFYETALFYYNVVVDLSWVLCYTAIEYACTREGKPIDISGIKSIGEASNLLRTAENNVTNPTAENNPFKYLKKMCPNFTDAIDQVIDFWNDFVLSDIRKKYNYCKHKGKPNYSELNRLSSRIMNLYFGDSNTGTFTKMASDISDVQYSFSLEESINELLEFDNNKLYPYIKKLIETIEATLNPSPMI